MEDLITENMHLRNLLKIRLEFHTTDMYSHLTEVLRKAEQDTVSKIQADSSRSTTANTTMIDVK